MARRLHALCPMHRALLLLVACTPPLRAPDPPPPQETEVAFRVDVPPPVVVVEGTAAPGAVATRDQPPHIKLRLGHYRSEARGLGVVIDRASGPATRARLRYDGTDQIVELDGQPGPARRIDFLDRKLRLVLQVHEGGHHSLWFYNPDGTQDGPIVLERDGDADPLPGSPR